MNKEIHISDIWNEEKNKSLKEFIRSHSQQQSKERKLRNDLLSIKYQIEDYIDTDNSPKKINLLDFIKMYLKTFNVTQKKLAELFEIRDSNLHKYLVGERKLNTDIVLKLSSFTHLSPEYWLRIEVKNELIEITKEKERNKDYQKYDYRNLFVTTGD